MSDGEKIDIFENGIRLPTHGHWVDIPGSPLQVRTLGHDGLGILWVRVRPGGYYDPNHWSCWS